MDGAIFDWKEGLANLNGDRRLYVRRLRDFMGIANDSLGTIFAAINAGELEKANLVVKKVRDEATELGAKVLAICATELALAIKAGADTKVLYGHFSSAVSDTLCRISGYLS